MYILETKNLGECRIVIRTNHHIYQNIKLFISNWYDVWKHIDERNEWNAIVSKYRICISKKDE